MPAGRRLADAPRPHGSPAAIGVRVRRARARGIPFHELKEEGRWLSDSSLRVYIDIQQAAAIAAGLRAAGLAPAQAWAGDHLAAFFTPQALAAAYA